MIDKRKLPPCNVVCEEEGLYIVEPADNGFVPMKHRAEEDRPREKLISKGADALTNAELFAILIGNGTRKKTAVELMQDILLDCGNRLSNLNRMTLQDLMAYSGIGEAKALTIIAAAELGRRRAAENAGDAPQMNLPTTVYEYMRPKVQDLAHEECWALLLNNDCRLICCTHISKGGLTETAVDVRMLLKQALLHDTTKMILVHNHPSGNTSPSRRDEQMTAKAATAAEAVGIAMIDHVIVSDGSFYSFAEHGKL